LKAFFKGFLYFLKAFFKGIPILVKAFGKGFLSYVKALLKGASYPQKKGASQGLFKGLQGASYPF